MIYEEINESLFISRFEDYDRVTRGDKVGNFTYRGLRALFNYLDDLHDEENPLELDVIALCCDFSEYENLEEYLNDYYTTEEIDEKLKEMFNTNEEKDLTDEQREEFKKVMEEEINDKTTLIKFEDDLNEGFIIGSY